MVKSPFPKYVDLKILLLEGGRKGKKIIFQSNHFLAEYLASIKLGISSLN